MAIVISGKNSIDILSPFCYIKITYLGKFFNRSVIQSPYARTRKYGGGDEAERVKPSAFFFAIIEKENVDAKKKTRRIESDG